MVGPSSAGTSPAAAVPPSRPQPRPSAKTYTAVEVRQWLPHLSYRYRILDAEGKECGQAKAGAFTNRMTFTRPGGSPWFKVSPPQPYNLNSWLPMLLPGKKRLDRKRGVRQVVTAGAQRVGEIRYPRDRRRGFLGLYRILAEVADAHGNVVAHLYPRDSVVPILPGTEPLGFVLRRGADVVGRVQDRSGFAGMDKFAVAAESVDPRLVLALVPILDRTADRIEERQSRQLAGVVGGPAGRALGAALRMRKL